MGSRRSVRVLVLWTVVGCAHAWCSLGCDREPGPPEPSAPPGTIYEAAARGDGKAVEAFLGQGIDVNELDGHGFPALYRAAVHGHEAVVALLLQRGADVDAPGKGKWTPLMGAGMDGHVGASRMLIDAGADVNAADDDGNTALHYAAGNAELAMTKMLIEAGAAVSARNARGQTPLKYLEEHYRTWPGHPVTRRRMKAAQAVMQLLRQR